MPRLHKEPETKIASCGDRLAINLADALNIDQFVREAMGLAAKLARDPILIDPDRMDETAVAFSCDLLTAACLLDVIRAHDRRAGAAVTRAYVNKGFGWVKLAAGALLTRGAAGQERLNPEVFSVAAVHEVALPKVERVF